MPTTIASVIGRNTSPAFSGEYPSTSCRYSERKNHIANVEAPSYTTTFAARQLPRAEDPQRHQRSLRDPALHRDEDRQQHDARGDREQRRRVAPAGAVGAHDAEHERRQPERRGDRAGEVEVARRFSLRPSSSIRCARKAAIRPIGRLMKRIQRQLRASVRMPPSSTPAAPPAPPIAPQMPTARLRAAPSCEGAREDRQRGGRDDRAAEALHDARGDQQDRGVGEAAGERGEREEHQPEDEHPPATEQVGGAAAEQQEAGERDRVGVDDPLQTVLGEVQRVLIEGSATFTTDTSRITMNCARQDRISVARRFGLSAEIVLMY